jgi:predicted AAA+ superfamily ATPase
MNKADLKKVIISQAENSREIKYVSRDNKFQDKISANDPFIRIITGVRRCGKSTLLQHIREGNAEKDFAINFDDNRLTGFSSEDFEKLYEAFNELFKTEKTWYFDEIQNISGWERFVRRLHNEGNKVFITGSNARMLSTELGTHLTGRYLQTELFPFTFAEYLRFADFEVNDKDFFTPSRIIILKKAFHEYVTLGGFPEFLQTKNPDYLKTLYDNIIYRDVVSRYGIKNSRILIEMAHFLISNISKETSYNALKKNFGIANAVTIKEYIGYLENCYLLFSVNKFDYSLKKQLANPKKIYCIDTGLAHFISFKFSENKGRQLENIVYLHLRKSNFDIYYHKNNFECDFIVVKNAKAVMAIQVCQSIDDANTRKRELRGLAEAMQMYSIPVGYIISEDEEETIEETGFTIKIIPIWKYLLT